MISSDRETVVGMGWKLCSFGCKDKKIALFLRNKRRLSLPLIAAAWPSPFPWWKGPKINAVPKVPFATRLQHISPTALRAAPCFLRRWKAKLQETSQCPFLSSRPAAGEILLALSGRQGFVGKLLNDLLGFWAHLGALQEIAVSITKIPSSPFANNRNASAGLNRKAAEHFSVLDFFGPFCIKTKGLGLRGQWADERKSLKICCWRNLTGNSVHSHASLDMTRNYVIRFFILNTCFDYVW